MNSRPLEAMTIASAFIVGSIVVVLSASNERYVITLRSIGHWRNVHQIERKTLPDGKDSSWCWPHEMIGLKCVRTNSIRP